MLLMCLQVNQEYVQVQAIVSQVSSIKLYKFEYVTQRGKTTLGRKTASWRVKLKRASTNCSHGSLWKVQHTPPKKRIFFEYLGKKKCAKMGICIENLCRIVHFCPKQHVKSYPKCTKLCRTPGIIFHIMPDTRNTWIWLVVVTSIKWEMCWYERDNISNYGEIENSVTKLCRTLCMSVRHNLS